MKKYLCCYYLVNSSLSKWPDDLVNKFPKHIHKSGIFVFEKESTNVEDFLRYINKNNLNVFKFETWLATGKDAFSFDYYYLNIIRNINLCFASGVDRSFSCNHESVCDNGTIQTSDLDLETKYLKKVDIQMASIGLPNAIIISNKFKEILNDTGVTGYSCRNLINLSPNYYQLEITSEARGPLKITGGNLTICDKCGVVKFYSSSEKQSLDIDFFCDKDFQFVKNIYHNNCVHTIIDPHVIISNKVIKLAVENKLTGFVKAAPWFNMMYMPIIIDMEHSGLASTHTQEIVRGRR